MFTHLPAFRKTRFMVEPSHSGGLHTPIRFLKGVGDSRAQVLTRLGIETVGDLLMHIPRRYEDRSVSTPLNDVEGHEQVSVRGQVLSCGWMDPKTGKGFFEAMLSDGRGVASCRWFNARYLEDRITKGMEIIAHGKVIRHRGRSVILQPEWEVAGNQAGSAHQERIVPIYPLTESLPQKTLRKMIWNAVEQFEQALVEILPAPLLERLQLPGIREAIRTVHFPESLEDAAAAHDRLVYNEFLSIQLVLAYRKRRAETVTKGHVHAGSGEMRTQFLESLEFDLTGAQKRVISEIEKDMRSAAPMHRLLQGDVGSGKTVVAACAMFDAIDGGAQVAVMAPTEVLARQHFKIFGRFLTRLGIDSALLVGDMPAGQRRNALAGLKSGRIKLAVGTHALIYDKVQFDNLALVIIDEQHKFGVGQRAELYGKGKHPDVLVMTATPIPRTLGMTIYGDLDVSTIDELPANRQQIVTRVIKQSQLHDAYGFMNKEVAKGRQCYVIYPLVGESETLDLKAAETMYEELREYTFKEERLGLLHGQMDNKDKNEVMRKFKEHELDILISTTVVEVGIDVPNATVMLIENAERFGLAQLHQLRGRVGRGEHKSYCILQGDAKGIDSWKRLKIMEETTDGFRIAEEDLKIRGMGNLLGKEQSGFPGFRIGDPVADTRLLIDSRDEAFRIAEADPDAADPQYASLRKYAKEIYKRTFAEIG
ncbi:MAG: ATP-dependent DNA helicase RecG [Kiritimatiellia bacterium]|jgi:ATP-dependent DNA helicase RecG